jgi:hypothetical protein
MNNLKVILTFLTLTLLYSCVHNSKKKENVIITKENKKETNKEISSIIEVSNDTIIACLYYDRGVIISINGGKTWNHLAKEYPIRDMTLTKDGLLVGILPCTSGSILFVSKDFGLSWKIIEYDDTKFCPIEIISKPKQQLIIKTQNKLEQSFNNSIYKIYKLTGSNFKSDWTYIKTINEKYVYCENQPSDYPYEIVHWNKLVKRDGKKVKQIMRLYTFTQINDIIYQNDIVNIAGDNMIEIVPGEKWDCKAYYGQYNKIWGYREFRIPGRYCYLRKSNLGNVYITSPEGLFIEEKGKIRQLY